MDAVEQINLRIVDLRSAVKFKNSEIRKLQQELASERVSDIQNGRRIRELESKINRLKDEVTQRLPDALKSAGEQLKLAEEAQREAERLLPEQKKLIAKIEEASRALLTSLMEAEKANLKLLKLNDGFRAMEAKTKSGLDLDSCSGGFMSIKVLIEVLEREIGGEGRVMFTYPQNFRI